MNILDYISLAFICAAIVFCSFKGIKKVIFKTAAFVISIIVAKLIGEKFGDLLLSEIIDLDVGILSEKVNGTIIAVLGTLILFVLLFVFLRLIFKVIEGKYEKNMQSMIVDRILGALVGFFIGVAVVFVFTEVVDIVFTVIATIKQDTDIFDLIDDSIIFTLLHNLN